MQVKIKSSAALKKLKGGHCVELWMTPGKVYEAEDGFTVEARNNAFGEDKPGYRITDDSGYTEVWTADYFDRV